MLGKIEGGRRRGQEGEMVGLHNRLNAHEFESTLGGTLRPDVLQPMGSQRVGH